MGSTLTRRSLLSSTGVLLLLIPVTQGIAACSSSTSSSGPANGCDGVFSTSDVQNNHTHTICVPSSDLSSPPASGATYTTSTDFGHTHTVALSQQQLQSINGGGSVTVLSTGVTPNHTFVVKKA